MTLQPPAARSQYTVSDVASQRDVCSVAKFWQLENPSQGHHFPHARQTFGLSHCKDIQPPQLCCKKIRLTDLHGMEGIQEEELTSALLKALRDSSTERTPASFSAGTWSCTLKAAENPMSSIRAAADVVPASAAPLPVMPDRSLALILLTCHDADPSHPLCSHRPLKPPEGRLAKSEGCPAPEGWEGEPFDKPCAGC